MNAAVEVRQKYARFRLLAIRIMVESQPALIGTVLGTLRDLLQSRIEDVRASATTELGELCSLANDPSAPVPRIWQSLCFDLLDKTLTHFLDRGMVPHAQSLIRHIASTTNDPEMFQEIFGHVVERVVRDGECKTEYVEAMCELLSRTVPSVVKLAHPDDLQRLQTCPGLCLHRSHCMNADSKLKVFEDHKGEPNRNNRVWRRLGGQGRVPNLTIRCTTVNGESCPKGCCKGTDISLGGTNSSTCTVPEESVLTDVGILLDVGGTQREFLISRAVVQRRYGDTNKNEMDGAGIVFLDWGNSLDALAAVICS